MQAGILRALGLTKLQASEAIHSDETIQIIRLSNALYTLYIAVA